MAWTYTGRPFSWVYGSTPGPTGQQNRDSVRYLIGDTDSTNQLQQDGEIDGLLNQNNGSVYQAAIEACVNLVARYALKANMTVGDLSIQYGAIAKAFTDLQGVIAKQAQRHDSPIPYAGGTSVGDMEDVNDDDDRPSPWATIGMDDDPNVAPSFGTNEGFTQVVPG